MSLELVSNRKGIRSRFRELDLGNNHSIVLSARKGIKTKLFYDLAETIKMPEKSLAAIINLSARTISNYTESKKNLEPIYGEHLLKIIALFVKGEAVFGTIEEFNYWLNKPFWNTKQTPLEWLVTSGGVDLLMEEVDKIAQGYPV
jgi:uncharacterized protein (DUF2384 family)